MTLERKPAIVNRLRRELMDFLVDVNRDKTLTLTKRGKICPRNLFRVKTDKRPRMFQKKIETERNTVDIVVAIDNSGSMNRRTNYSVRESKIDIAMDLGYQLSLALDGIEGINCMMFGFTFVRNKVRHRIFKHFKKKLCQNYKDYQRLLDMWDNNDYESIKWACQQLRKQNGKRKFLFVISDGCPSAGDIDSSALHRETKELVKHESENGIVIIPFFVGSSAEFNTHKRIYEKSVNVGDNLNGTVVDKLIELVKRG